MAQVLQPVQIQRRSTFMPQTILALLALMLALTLTLNQREVATTAQQRLLQNEIGMVATGVANQVFDRIGGKAFDAAGQVASPSEFRRAADFGSAESWEAAFTIDDFHGKSTEVPVENELGEIVFNVSAEVHYVESNGGQFEVTTERQYLKQVTIEIEGPLGFSVELARVYSYFDSPPGA